MGSHSAYKRPLADKYYQQDVIYSLERGAYNLNIAGKYPDNSITYTK